MNFILIVLGLIAFYVVFTIFAWGMFLIGNQYFSKKYYSSGSSAAWKGLATGHIRPTGIKEKIVNFICFFPILLWTYMTMPLFYIFRNRRNNTL